MLPLLLHIATQTSGPVLTQEQRRSYFIPGFLVFGCAMVVMASTPQTRLIALIAASGNRSLGGSSSSSKKRGCAGGAGAAAGAGISPRAFGDDRGAAPALYTIDADDLYAAFDPDGRSTRYCG